MIDRAWCIAAGVATILGLMRLLGKEPRPDYSLVDAGVAKYAAADVGRWSRIAHPGQSWCLRCGVTWDGIGGNSGHTVYYKGDERAGWGCFPACEECWQKSSLDERLKIGDCLLRCWASDLPMRFACFNREINPEDAHDCEAVRAAIHREWIAKPPVIQEACGEE